MTNRGCKFPILFTDEQKQIANRWIGSARVVYNGKVREDKARYLKFKESGEKTSPDQGYSFLKDDFIWMKEVPSQILRNAAVGWYQSKIRQMKKIAKTPVIHKRKSKESVLLTKELFTISTKEENGKTRHFVTLGTKKFPFGVAEFFPHREFGQPLQIRIVRDNDRFFISFSYENGLADFKTNEELLEEFSLLPESVLADGILSSDLGIVIPVARSDRVKHEFSVQEKRSITTSRIKLTKLQRKLARQQKGSKKRLKTKIRLGKVHKKIANVRMDFQNKVSRKIAEDAPLIVVFEDIKVQNMTRSPKAKKGENGKWLPNGKRAKAGLNRAILNVGFGRIRSEACRKANELGKAFYKEVARNSSRECDKCGHTDPLNRPTQSLFLCGNCGHSDNADFNATAILKKRAVISIKSGSWKKIKKSVKAGTACSACRGHVRPEKEEVISQSLAEFDEAGRSPQL